MAYKAALTKNFLKEFGKLLENARDRILRSIDEIVANPFSGFKLRGERGTLAVESREIQNHIQN